MKPHVISIARIVMIPPTEFVFVGILATPCVKLISAQAPFSEMSSGPLPAQDGVVSEVEGDRGGMLLKHPMLTNL